MNHRDANDTDWAMGAVENTAPKYQNTEFAADYVTASRLSPSCSRREQSYIRRCDEGLIDVVVVDFE